MSTPASIPRSRALKSVEERRIHAILLELRRHFRGWIKLDDPDASEHDLIAFAEYEGQFGTQCCAEILAKASPFAVGRQLVRKNGFKWCMVESDGAWHYGVRHDRLEQPIRLDTLEDGSMLVTPMKSERYPGLVTHKSYEGIVVTLTKAPPVGGRRRG
jgi:hypothetical protein